METVSIITIITIAFLGSFGHCIGMCGGIVLAYTSIKIKSSYSKQFQAILHLLYSFGRITTYVILGIIFGSIGAVASYDNHTSAILLLLSGSIMVLIGFSILGKIKFLTVLEHNFSKSKIYQKTFKIILSSNSYYSFFVLGMLNGLLPCGFVYLFAITAASTGSSFWGGFVMLIFGLSTLPSLFFVGFFVGIFKQTSMRSLIIKIASLLVIIFGIFIIYNGYTYISDPNKSILNCHI